MSTQGDGRMKGRSALPMNGQVAKRTAGAEPTSVGSRTAASLVGPRWGQDEKRRLAVHPPGPFAAHSPTPSQHAVVQPDAEDAHDLAFGFVLFR